MIFITQEQIALLESKFHFQIEDWNLPTVDSFKITNVDWLVTYVNQKFTREIRNRWRLLVSIGSTLQGIFLNFQEHFLCIYSRLVLKKLFFTVLLQQTTSSLLKVFAINILLSEHKSSQIGQATNSLRVVPYRYTIISSLPWVLGITCRKPLKARVYINKIEKVDYFWNWHWKFVLRIKEIQFLGT